MTTFSLREAAEAGGTSKSTIWRAIRSGRMSAARTDDGGFAIDPAELFRVFPPQRAESPQTGQDATSPATDDMALRSAATAALERENELLRQMVDDLRKALTLADRLSLAAPVKIENFAHLPPADSVQRQLWWRRLAG